MQYLEINIVRQTVDRMSAEQIRDLAEYVVQQELRKTAREAKKRNRDAPAAVIKKALSFLYEPEQIELRELLHDAGCPPEKPERRKMVGDNSIAEFCQ